MVLCISTSCLSQENFPATTIEPLPQVFLFLNNIPLRVIYSVNIVDWQDILSFPPNHCTEVLQYSNHILISSADSNKFAMVCLS